MIEVLERAAGRPVSRETVALLETYVEQLKTANSAQNLIAASTLDRVWELHIFDSSQLVTFQPRPAAMSVDIGSGTVLPRADIAALFEAPFTLVAPLTMCAVFP